MIPRDNKSSKVCFGCSNPIEPPKWKWCSNRCKKRMWMKHSGYISPHNPESRLKINHNFYARRRAWLDNLKTEPCMDCHSSFPPECMDFDHIRGNKIQNIAQLMFNATQEKILQEVAKCDLVCANCHRIRTKQRRGYYSVAP